MPMPVNILLVDDQPRNLVALEAILESPEYRLVRAESAEAALLALLRDEFAAIVLDVKMPGMSGPELAQLIKRREKTRHVPILFLTAHAQDEQEILQAYDAGGVDYLNKPFHPQVLRSKIAVFAELFRMARQLSAANLALEAEVAQRERARQQLRQANEELEKRVAERTADLTEINEALERAKAEAESASEAKDRFLAVLSHELRTPLTPVLVTLQLLESEASLSDATRESLATVRRNVELEARLIDDLLDLTRVARGKLPLYLQSVNLNVLVRQAMEICSPEAQEKGVRLVLDSMAESPHVRGDPARLQQVLWNVIKNAVKFTPLGGDVRISCRNEPPEEGGRIVISVADTGIGIEPDKLARVFDAFEQGDQAVGRQFGGLGLGLAISKALMELHHGTIRAHSAGHMLGATFTISLPVAVQTETPLEPADPAAGAANAADFAGAGRLLRVLLVEDHADSARVLVQLLRRLGCAVEHAPDVASALACARQSSFDLIISDLGLPDGSGHDLIRTLASQAPVRAIALSGYGMEADLQRSYESGFQEHLTKPVTISQLKSAIDRVAGTDVAAANPNSSAAAVAAK